MNGYDIDGVLTSGHSIELPAVVISGRTFAEYDVFAKAAAEICPVYIRGVGAYGDQYAAGLWKAEMIIKLGVTKFYEDDPVQIAIINELVPSCVIVQVGDAGK
jgi:hypothetical protein